MEDVELREFVEQRLPGLVAAELVTRFGIPLPEGVLGDQIRETTRRVLDLMHQHQQINATAGKDLGRESTATLRRPRLTLGTSTQSHGNNGKLLDMGQGDSYYL
jgi:hypothetical protein